MPLINQGHLFFESSTNTYFSGLIRSGNQTEDTLNYCIGRFTAFFSNLIYVHYKSLGISP